VILERLDWRWLFWVNVPFCVAGFPVPATQIHRRTTLAGLINEYRQAA